MSARGSGCPLRKCRVDPDAAEVTRPDNVGKEAKLTDGAGAFAAQPFCSQPGLGGGPGDQFLADRFDILCDGVQEARVAVRAPAC